MASESYATFRMAIDRVFWTEDRGPVVTGNVESGVVEVGDEITIVTESGQHVSTPVEGMEAFNKKIQKASAGDFAGLLLSRTDVTEDVLRACEGGLVFQAYDVQEESIAREVDPPGSQTALPSVAVRPGGFNELANSTVESEDRRPEQLLAAMASAIAREDERTMKLAVVEDNRQAGILKGLLTKAKRIPGGRIAHLDYYTSRARPAPSGCDIAILVTMHDMSTCDFLPPPSCTSVVIFHVQSGRLASTRTPIPEDRMKTAPMSLRLS